MSKRDWFRKTTWTEEDQIDFWAHFKRVRTEQGKAQNLRIQALCIQSDYPMASLELLDKLLKEFPVRIQLALAHLQRGQILLAEGKIDLGLSALKDALDQEKALPNVRTQAWVEYGSAVLKHQKTDLYDGVEGYVSERIKGLIFPSQKYHANALLALIQRHRGNNQEAIAYAKTALTEAGVTFSGFAAHPTMGLVDDPDAEILERLKALASTVP